MTETPACPNCSGHGLARAVSLKGRERKVTYVCEVCHHEWDIRSEAPEPPVRVAPHFGQQ